MLSSAPWTRDQKIALAAYVSQTILGVLALVLTTYLGLGSPPLGAPMIGTLIWLFVLLQLVATGVFAIYGRRVVLQARKDVHDAYEARDVAVGAERTARNRAEGADSVAEKARVAAASVAEAVRTFHAEIEDRRWEWLQCGASVHVNILNGVVLLERRRVVFDVEILHFGGLEAKATDLVLNGLCVHRENLNDGPVKCELDAHLPHPQWRRMTGIQARFAFDILLSPRHNLTAIVQGKNAVRVSWMGGTYRILKPDGSEITGSLYSGSALVEVQP